VHNDPASWLRLSGDPAGSDEYGHGYEDDVIERERPSQVNGL